MDEERAIETLNVIIEYGWLISDMEKCTAIDACELAIDRIHKCQKIEKIIKNWKDGTIEEKDSVYAFHKIMEIVEDENDTK